MKDYIILEINSRRKALEYIQIPTPSPYILCNNMEAIMNNRIFDEFMDDVFALTIDELQNDYKKKITNVYVTFFDNHDVSVCSFVLYRLNPKKRTYKLKKIDWVSIGKRFKFVKNEEVT